MNTTPAATTTRPTRKRTFEVAYTMGGGSWISTVEDTDSPSFARAAAMIAARRSDDLTITVHSITETR